MRQTLAFQKHKALLLICLLCCSSLLFRQASAQSPSIQWQKTLGGTQEDLGSHSIIQSSDNGIITGGVVSSKDGDGKGNHGGKDLLVVNMSAAGVIKWKRVLGGAQDERGTFLVQARDGGIIVGGTTSSNNGDVSGNHGAFDIWVVKLDASGTIKWQKTIGGSGDEHLVAVRENSTGDILIGGTTFLPSGGFNSSAADYILAKLSSSGTLLWQKTLGGSSTDRMNQLQATADGGCIAVGMTSSQDGNVTGYHGGYRDTWVVRLGANGNLLWQRALGGSGDEFYTAVQVTTVNGVEGYVIAVRTDSNNGDVSGNHGGLDIWVVKLGYDGTLQWQNTFGGSGWEELGSIKPTKDGGFILGATTASNDGNVSGNHGSNDAWLVKIDGSGKLQWQKTLGGTASDEIMYFQQTTDNGYIVNVFDQSNNGDGVNFHGKIDVLLVKLDAQGSMQWNRCFGGSNEEWPLNRESHPYDNIFTTFATAHDEYQLQSSDGNYMFLTSTISNDGDVQDLHYSARVGLRYDNWVVKVAPPVTSSKPVTTVSPDKLRGERLTASAIAAYPNPFNRQTVLHFTALESGRTTIDLYNAKGAKVRTLFNGMVKAGAEYTVPVDGAVLPKGIYFYDLNNQKDRQSGRLIKH